MRVTRKAPLFAATVLLASGVLAGTAGTADAATPKVVTPMVEGNFPIAAADCHVIEEIELQGSPAHDYMRWETDGDSKGCDVEINDNGTWIEAQYNLTAGYHHSNWYYDGPGHSMQVWVASSLTDQWYKGRLN